MRAGKSDATLQRPQEECNVSSKMNVTLMTRQNPPRCVNTCLDLLFNAPVQLDPDDRLYSRLAPSHEMQRDSFRAKRLD